MPRRWLLRLEARPAASAIAVFQLPSAGESTGEGALKSRISAIEFGMIVDALKSYHGNISKAADQLGLSHRMLRLRMEKYGLDYKAFRRPD